MAVNPNYEENEKGEVWKKDKSEVKGNAGFFARPIPPVRDGAGRPMKDKDHVDWQRWADEIEEKRSK